MASSDTLSSVESSNARNRNLLRSMGKLRSGRVTEDVQLSGAVSCYSGFAVIGDKTRVRHHKVRAHQAFSMRGDALELSRQPDGSFVRGDSLEVVPWRNFQLLTFAQSPTIGSKDQQEALLDFFEEDMKNEGILADMLDIVGSDEEINIAGPVFELIERIYERHADLRIPASLAKERLTKRLHSHDPSLPGDRAFYLSKLVLSNCVARVYIHAKSEILSIGSNSRGRGNLQSRDSKHLVVYCDHANALVEHPDEFAAALRAVEGVGDGRLLMVTHSHPGELSTHFHVYVLERMFTVNAVVHTVIATGNMFAFGEAKVLSDAFQSSIDVMFNVLLRRLLAAELERRPGSVRCKVCRVESLISASHVVIPEPFSSILEYSKKLVGASRVRLAIMLAALYTTATIRSVPNVVLQLCGPMFIMQRSADRPHFRKFANDAELQYNLLPIALLCAISHPLGLKVFNLVMGLGDYVAHQELGLPTFDDYILAPDFSGFRAIKFPTHINLLAYHEPRFPRVDAERMLIPKFLIRPDSHYDLHLSKFLSLHAPHLV